MGKKKVMVGMSGGVDSAVAAALLQEQGYHVAGATMRLWPHAGDQQCADARRICETLGIDFYVMDFQGLFREKVVDYFVHAYMHARTPNPCVACNKYLKFGAFMEKARDLDMDYIATGHYAKIERADGLYRLRMSDAQNKDQSYFLYNLTQEQLAHTLMPLGSYRKDQVRELAKERGLAVADKPDSMDICFVENGDYTSFIKEYAAYTPQEGDILDTDGNVIGRHRGLIYYTIGQRKGIGAYGKPMFVLGMDAERNTLTLGAVGMEFADTLLAADVHFISKIPLKESLEVTAKVRYQARPEPAVLYPEGDFVRVAFNSPQRAVTPGQSVVFYDGDIVLGGGIVLK